MFPFISKALLALSLAVCSASSIANTAAFQAVVGPAAQSSSFRVLNHPDVLSAGSVPNTYQLSYIIGSTAPTHLKFFFPPGTVTFTANFLAYLSQMESKGVMRLGSPPQVPAFAVSSEMADAAENSGSATGGQYGGAFNGKILSNLLSADRDVFFYGAAGAGLMPISYGGDPITPVPSNGGYVYAEFQYPGGVLGATQWNVYVDKSCYRQWYENASWDSLGNPAEGVVHSCSGSSGSASGAAVSEVEMTDQALSLKLTLSNGDMPSNVAQSSISYWLLAMVPAGSVFNADPWGFFLVGNPAGGARWLKLEGDVSSPYDFAYKVNEPLTQAINRLTFPVNLPVSDMRAAGITFELAYKVTGSPLKVVGKVWQ